MSYSRKSHYCRSCQHQQVFIRTEPPDHFLHFLLTIGTLGLWGVSWLSLSVGARSRPMRCQHCDWALDKTPEFSPSLARR